MWWVAAELNDFQDEMAKQGILIALKLSQNIAS